uniref:Uncharacterized protein n=1 Tax=Clytia hemisphaerica TaxID=252671 RepID=A0A7M5V9M7_9CNID|eukprot:TCONS_00066204-protein
MDLFEDLDENRWENKGHPPLDPSSIEGYTSYIVFQRQIVEDAKTMILYLKTEQGRPLQVKLSNFKPDRNPMKSVRNCCLKIRKNEIVGIMMDRDWVEAK